MLHATVFLPSDSSVTLKEILCFRSTSRLIATAIPPNYSIVLCAHNDIVSAVDSKRIVGLVLLDLSATFDTLDHDTLLSVLQQRFGVCDSALSWVKSYLSDRTENFLVNGVSSGSVAVNCSVPQSSVLGRADQFYAATDQVYLIHGRRQHSIPPTSE